MAPTAALATTTQTPRPPCSAPHRPARLGPRGPGEFRRPRESRGPPGPRAAPSLIPRGWVTADRVPVGGVDPGGRPPGTPCCLSRGDPSPRTSLGRDPSPRLPPGTGIRRVRASAPGSPPRRAGARGSHPLPPARRGPGSRPVQLGSRPRGSDPRESPRPPPGSPALSKRPGSRRGVRSAADGVCGAPVGGVRAPAGGVRGMPGGVPGSRPRGLAPGSLPYGLLGRASRHCGSLICTLDVSRYALGTGA
jgi:translation initiation factor IF-2